MDEVARGYFTHPHDQQGDKRSCSLNSYQFEPGTWKTGGIPARVVHRKLATACAVVGNCFKLRPIDDGLSEALPSMAAAATVRPKDRNHIGMGATSI